MDGRGVYINIMMEGREGIMGNMRMDGWMDGLTDASLHEDRNKRGCGKMTKNDS